MKWGRRNRSLQKKSITMSYISHHFKRNNNKNRRCPEFVMDLIGELLVDLSLMYM